MVSSAYFVGNTLGPLTGGTIAATIGIRFVFVVTAAAADQSGLGVVHRAGSACRSMTLLPL